MSIINNGLLLASGADAAVGYQISRSLRFNGSIDSAHLSRTPASAGTSRTTWTLSFWVKRSTFSTAQWLFFSSDLTANTTAAYFTASDTLEFYEFQSGSYVARLITTQVFRDPSAWYHFVFTWDTNNGTSGDRLRIYVNNQRIDAFSTSTYPGSGTQSRWNNNVLHYLSRGVGSEYFAGYLANIEFVDGSALTPSSFGETDATTGQWIPKLYSGSYGTNGFRLTFSDNSGTTSTTLGKDAAGSNNWSPNNFSVASGSGNDSLVDSPSSYGTDTGAGSEVRGNYALANALDNGGQTLANGNLDITGISSNWRSTRGTIGMSSGKWYWEVTIGFTNGASNQSLLGIATGAASISGNYASAGAYGWEYYSSNGNKFNNGSNPSYGASYTNGDVIGVAFDADAGSLTFYKNGSSQGTAYTGLTSGPYFPSFSLYGVSLVSFNGGQRAFAYTAPSGFKALCDTNLTAPVVAKPSTVMDVKLYTGNGSTQTISGLGFSPDFVWLKSRSSGSYSHNIYDVVRGATKIIYSDSTSAENTDANGLTAFNSDGFSLGSTAATNASSTTYVGWCWDAGTSTVTNTQGSITSSVRANASAGFSVVSVPGYTYPTKTAGHGLGVEPHFIITKNRGVSNPWMIYHKAAGANTYFQFDTGAGYTGVPGVWSGVNSTVFPINSGINQQTDIIAYCFAPVAGYSSFGSYTGNGSSDGPFVYTGFRPRWVMIKRSDSASASYGWFILDTARNTYNVMNTWLAADNSAADGADIICDTLANGFKIRTTAGNINTNAGTFVYACFAENPFQYARAR